MVDLMTGTNQSLRSKRRIPVLGVNLNALPWSALNLADRDVYTQDMKTRSLLTKAYLQWWMR